MVAARAVRVRSELLQQRWTKPTRPLIGRLNRFPEVSRIMNRAAASHVLDRVLVLEMVRVTEAAAVAASS